MSRSHYTEDCGDDVLVLGRWRGQVTSAIRGKRGQAFLKDLVNALEAMPNKSLVGDVLRKDGEVCALGALGVARGLDLESLDPEDPEQVAEAFGIAPQLVQEIVYINDDDFKFRREETPENRWYRVYSWAKNQIKEESDSKV